MAPTLLSKSKNVGYRRRMSVSCPGPFSGSEIEGSTHSPCTRLTYFVAMPTRYPATSWLTSALV